ncbi:MAG: phosphatidylglycerol lysyltransferase domain-containing protein [Nitrospira sp.]|jgi:Fe-S-cluster containining protein|nr:phosphatidylglycerol lysyltransferase domain-containing protein [Nitrospira sp.]
MTPVQMECHSQVTLLPLLPQMVPGAVCAQCDVCCRFPESDSFLRPYFTRDEIRAAVSLGLSPALFDDPAGSQIALVKDPAGEGYHCPAFDAGRAQCGIYQQRPLDCQLYPLALMWSEAGDQILLGWDTKCPFMREAVPNEIRLHGERVQQLLGQEPALRVLEAHPRLIGRYQDDVVVLAPLPDVTRRVRAQQPDRRLQPLRLADASTLAAALHESEMLGQAALAARAFPYHYVWTTTLPYWWMEQKGVFWLFAQSPDGWFMPLPPFGPGSFEGAVREGLALLREWNGASPVSRIENLTDGQKNGLDARAYRFSSKSPDYLYRAEALANLAGDRYKSQRALCNRVEREQPVTFESYRPGDHQEGCRSLYRQWVAQKQAGRLDQMGQWLLEDAEAAHEIAWALGERIGLAGTVARVGDQIAGYTFGYWLTPATFAVLFEVADRSVPGLAQALFRQTCRTALRNGATWINAMDDAGLPGLQAAKMAYHPAAMVNSWIAMAR